MQMWNSCLVGDNSMNPWASLLAFKMLANFSMFFSIWPSSRYLYKSRMPGWLAPCAIFSTPIIQPSRFEFQPLLLGCFGRSWIPTEPIASWRFFFLGGRRLGWPGQSCMEKKGWLTSRDSVWSLSIKSTWSWKVSRFTGDLWQKASLFATKGCDCAW